MQLTAEEKQLLLHENIKDKIIQKDLSLKTHFNHMVKEFLEQFGIPCKEELVSLNNKAKNYNGFYDASAKAIVLCPNSIKDNNFQYFHTLVHESTHLIQYFLIENGISRNSIDKLDLEDYQKMSRKFFKDKSIEVTQEMLDKFKSFVKEEPFLENEKMKYLAQDIFKYKNFGTIYYNNIGEIMANDFGVRELTNVLKEYSITSNQYAQLNECLNKDVDKIDKIRPEQKRLTSLAQNIFTMPQNHIRHAIALIKMQLSPIVENSKEMINETQYNVSENVKDVRIFIDIDNAPENGGSITRFVKQKNQENSLANDVLSFNGLHLSRGMCEKNEEETNKNNIGDKNTQEHSDEDLEI